MKKIILDFNTTRTREDVHKYLAMKFDFPDYYGENLDALYDCLTDIGEPTCAGFFMPDEEREMTPYLQRIAHVMRDAEDENKNFAVIFGDMEANFEDELEFMDF